MATRIRKVYPKLEGYPAINQKNREFGQKNSRVWEIKFADALRKKPTEKQNGGKTRVRRREKIFTFQLVTRNFYGRLIDVYFLAARRRRCQHWPCVCVRGAAVVYMQRPAKDSSV